MTQRQDQDDEKTAFPASPATPGQVESRQARQAFLANAKDCPWLQDYLQLRLEGWDWRKAAYIAWKASPMAGRWPDTQQKLAAEVLGLKSDRTIRTWIEKQPEIEERVARLQVEPLFAFRRDVITALIESSRVIGKNGAPDRRTYLTLTGDLKPKNEQSLVKHNGASPFEGINDDELERVIRNLQAAIGSADADSEVDIDEED